VAWLAHVGDSRAVLVAPGAAGPVVESLTRDHVPSDAAEAAALAARGGTLVDGLVGGVLSMTRSLGDAALGTAVSPVPDVRRVALAPPGVLVLASDGLWAAVTPARVGALVVDACWPAAAADAKAVASAALVLAAERCVAEALLRGGADDDITVLLVGLEGQGAAVAEPAA
jgi:serine/threonine protein phosphatase PrpC